MFTFVICSHHSNNIQKLRHVGIIGFNVKQTFYNRKRKYLNCVYHGRSHQIVQTVFMGVKPACEGNLRDYDYEHDAEESGQAIPRVLESTAPA